MKQLTEDQVREQAWKILWFSNTDNVQSWVGQITTFNQLWFKWNVNKPDWRYLPENKNDTAIILETKSTSVELKESQVEELLKNCRIVSTKYKNVIWILHNGIKTRTFKNEIEISAPNELQNKEFYLKLFNENKIDKQQIYAITKRINDSLHFDFGIKNLYHRMIFTACALVAARYGAFLSKWMDYPTFHTSILSWLSKSLWDHKWPNSKLNLLLEVYGEIKMNYTQNQGAIDDFIGRIQEISDLVNSDYWNWEDVMGIFFNEFNRYKKKSESWQVFTPDHITSFMYRIIEVNKDDIVLDAACGSGAFLVKSMCNMVKEAWGINTNKAKEIKKNQLYGIEFDREIYALACANMLIHKDWKTNLEQMDSRTQEACNWIKSKHITKVLMNPPFENKYWCVDIVENVLDSVERWAKCAFIMPDKKLEKVSKTKVENILMHHTLKKIIKLPEETFDAWVTTSIFVFEAWIPQNFEEDIFACYIEKDWLERVKNQWRQDIKDRWQEIEDERIEIIKKQTWNDTTQRINPKEFLSYQMPKKEFEISEKDFEKTVMDYLMFEEWIDVKEFKEELINKVMYNSEVEKKDDKVFISINGNKENE